MSFNAIRENKIVAKISGLPVSVMTVDSDLKVIYTLNLSMAHNTNLSFIF